MKQKQLLLQEILNEETTEIGYLLPEFNFLVNYVKNYNKSKEQVTQLQFGNCKDLIIYLNTIFAIRILKKVNWEVYLATIRSDLHKIKKIDTFFAKHRIIFCKARLFVQYLLAYLLNPFLSKFKSELLLGKIIIEEQTIQNINLSFEFLPECKNTVFNCNNMSMFYTIVIFSLKEEQMKTPRYTELMLISMFKMIYIHQLQNRPSSVFLSKHTCVEFNLNCFASFFETLKLPISESLQNSIGKWIKEHHEWHAITDKNLRNEHSFRKGDSTKPPKGITSATKLYRKTIKFLYSLR